MGQPSLAIYVTELIKFYGVKTLIRVGTCGGLAEGVELKDLILASAASTDGNMNRLAFDGLDFAPAADFNLLRHAAETADRLKLNIRAGGILSSDNFYAPEGAFEPWIDHGVLGAAQSRRIPDAALIPSRTEFIPFKAIFVMNGMNSVLLSSTGAVLTSDHRPSQNRMP